MIGRRRHVVLIVDPDDRQPLHADWERSLAVSAVRIIRQLGGGVRIKCDFASSLPLLLALAEYRPVATITGKQPGDSPVQFLEPWKSESAEDGCERPIVDESPTSSAEDSVITWDSRALSLWETLGEAVSWKRLATPQDGDPGQLLLGLDWLGDREREVPPPAFLLLVGGTWRSRRFYQWFEETFRKREVPLAFRLSAAEEWYSRCWRKVEEFENRQSVQAWDKYHDALRSAGGLDGEEELAIAAGLREARWCDALERLCESFLGEI
ncbi:MAG: hypothetical protein U0935_12805 [Pirellulales bacterium]